MSDDEPEDIAELLAQMTARPVDEFEATGFTIPDFDEQELEPVDGD